MKTIALLNEKGGVGKTTLSTYLAVGLAVRGNRVLLLDADAQSNATQALGVAKSSAFADLMLHNAGWNQALTKSGVTENLYVVASSLATAAVASSIEPVTVARRLAEVVELFDYVVIDTSPTPTLLHDAITLASDYVLIPTDCESFSAWEGLPDSLAHIQRMRDQAASAGLDVARVLGIVPNRYRSGVALHEHFLKNLREEYGDLVWEAIPLRTAIAESQVMRQFLIIDAPQLETAKMLNGFIERVIGGVA
jgi:chromosome partitioning protein